MVKSAGKDSFQFCVLVQKRFSSNPTPTLVPQSYPLTKIIYYFLLPTRSHITLSSFIRTFVERLPTMYVSHPRPNNRIVTFLKFSSKALNCHLSAAINHLFSTHPTYHSMFITFSSTQHHTPFCIFSRLFKFHHLHFDTFFLLFILIYCATIIVEANGYNNIKMENKVMLTLSS